MPELERETLHRNREWKSSIAQENLGAYLEYRNHSFPWRENSAKLEDARFGRQFSPSEMEQLLIFRQAPLPISVSTAICDTADALHVSAKPTISVSPIINPYDETKSTQSREVAGIYKHLIQKAWFDAMGGLQYDKAVFDRTTVGHGLLYAVPRMEFGEFKVDVKNISWKYFYPDPSSVDPLYTDADAMVYSMPITRKSAYKFVHSIEPDLSYEDFEKDFAKGASVSSAFFEEDPIYRRPMQSQNFLHFIQRLTIEDDYSYLIIPKGEGQIGKAGVTYRTSTMITDDLKAAEAKGEIEIRRRHELFLAEYTSIGNYGYKIVYPIRNYNIVPIQHDHRGTPYPYSLMWYLYPLQRALNKFIMSSILNMSLLNTTKVMAEENSIIDMNEWTMNASQPNAILRYRVPIPGYSKAPEIIKPSPMDAAFLVMPQYITKMMEYISGIYATLQGNPQDSPDVFSTVASLQSAGGQKIKRRQALADASLSQLGKVIGEFYKEYAPMNGYSFTYDPQTGQEDIVKYNELQTNIDKDEDGTPVPKIIVNPSNDLRTGFKDVRFISTGSMGYESATEAAMLTTLATQLSVPDLIPAILERINIPGLEGIQESIKNRTDLTGQLEQAQKITQALESDVKKKNDQLEQFVLRLKGSEHKGKMDVELQKFKDNPEQYIRNSLNYQGAK